MASRRIKAVAVHLLLISASFIQPIVSQQQFSKAKQSSFLPQNQFTTFPSNKGFYPLQTGMGQYYTQPVNTQYWTGTHVNHLQNPQFQQPFYPQHNGYPYYNNYNQFGPWNTPQMGSNQFNMMPYQQFDASYWTGSFFKPNHFAPVYPHQLPVNPYPVYPHQPVYHPAYNNRYMHPGHYPYHPAQFGPSPYNQRGFFGGTGKGLTKGLLGALLVGVVAGTVARGK